MGGLCIIGGTIGFVKSQSIPSLVAGVRCVFAISAKFCAKKHADRNEVWACCTCGAEMLYGKGHRMAWKVHLVRHLQSRSLYSQTDTNFHMTGASALLLLSSLPRVAKGPVPAVLSLASAGAGLYYGNTLYALRK